MYSSVTDGVSIAAVSAWKHSSPLECGRLNWSQCKDCDHSCSHHSPEPQGSWRLHWAFAAHLDMLHEDSHSCPRIKFSAHKVFISAGPILCLDNSQGRFKLWTQVKMKSVEETWSRPLTLNVFLMSVLPACQMNQCTAFEITDFGKVVDLEFNIFKAVCIFFHDFTWWQMIVLHSTLSLSSELVLVNCFVLLTSLFIDSLAQLSSASFAACGGSCFQQRHTKIPLCTTCPALNGKLHIF